MNFHFFIFNSPFYFIRTLTTSFQWQKGYLIYPSEAIEILVLLIATHFACAKSSPNGFFERDMWLKTQTKIAELLEDLKNHNIEAKKQKTEKKEDGGDLDTFLSSGDSQILPGIVAFIEKLDQQLYKAFQSLTSTSIEYL